MIEAVGGRKMLLTLLVVAVGVAIDLVHGLSPTMAAFLGSTVAAFHAGNVGASFAAAASSDTAEPEPAAPPPQDTTHAELDEIKQGVSVVQQALSLIIHKYGIASLPDPQPVDTTQP